MTNKLEFKLTQATFENVIVNWQHNLVTVVILETTVMQQVSTNQWGEIK